MDDPASASDYCGTVIWLLEQGKIDEGLALLRHVHVEISQLEAMHERQWIRDNFQSHVTCQ